MRYASVRPDEYWRTEANHSRRPIRSLIGCRSAWYADRARAVRRNAEASRAAAGGEARRNVGREVRRDSARENGRGARDARSAGPARSPRGQVEVADLPAAALLLQVGDIAGRLAFARHGERHGGRRPAGAAGPDLEARDLRDVLDLAVQRFAGQVLGCGEIAVLARLQQLLDGLLRGRGITATSATAPTAAFLDVADLPLAVLLLCRRGVVPLVAADRRGERHRGRAAVLVGLADGPLRDRQEGRSRDSVTERLAGQVPRGLDVMGLGGVEQLVQGALGAAGPLAAARHQDERDRDRRDGDHRDAADDPGLLAASARRRAVGAVARATRSRRKAGTARATGATGTTGRKATGRKAAGATRPTRAGRRVTGAGRRIARLARLAGLARLARRKSTRLREARRGPVRRRSARRTLRFRPLTRLLPGTWVVGHVIRPPLAGSS